LVINKSQKNLPTRVFAKMILDLMAFGLSYSVSHFLRFDLQSLSGKINELMYLMVIYLIIRSSSFYLFKLYSEIWRFSGIHTMISLLKANTLGTILIVLLNYFATANVIPRSVLVLDWFLVFFFTGGTRILTRILYSYDWSFINRKKKDSQKRILIYGAGQAGELLLRNIENAKTGDIHVVGFIDDDTNKKGKYIHNKPILGRGIEIGNVVEKYDIDSIYLSIPSLSGLENRKILNSITSQVADKVEIKTIPGLVDLMQDKFSISQLRNFEIVDLLRRKPVQLDYQPVAELIKNKAVLVVGGGGSIGSELCRQIASFQPECIIVLDNTEYNCYRTEEILLKEKLKTKIVTIVADAVNEKILYKIFSYYQPNIVFHAAAYKHVPMMEMNPWAATNNNLRCTLNLTALCKDFNVERFILISTDKAVQPTSVMGATKRICEQIVQLYNGTGETKFITVRFGNVLGSSGSVIPKFKEQIANGGPVTVTHPEICRYFMLISEAVELVLQAAAIGESGNIYVLDMGEPIKIIDLAKYMIKLSGLKLDAAIAIEFTGLRPGEKIRESLYLRGEEKLTGVPNLFVLTPQYTLNKNYLTLINEFLTRSYTFNHQELRTFLKKLVPEYEPYIAQHIRLPFTEPNEVIEIKFESA